jgi:biopolymer transport protein ExbB
MAFRRKPLHVPATIACAIAILAAGAAPAAAQEPAVEASALLPRDLSPWGMFMSADIIVKAVMVGLVFASFVTWTTWLAKTIEILSTQRRLRSAMITLGAAQTLAHAAQSHLSEPAASFCANAIAELRLSAGAVQREGLKERIGSRLERLEATFGRRLNRGTGILATIGATAPFVGLFGTVWGIMNSFIGISRAQTTNLAVVAPGIAEALLATALGLAAAIPAVVIYNLFSRQITGCRTVLGDIAAEVLRLASRDLDRALPAGKTADPPSEQPR